MKSVDGKYACNFQVLNEHTICANITKIKKAPWFEELKSSNISFTDLENSTNISNETIDILIGANVAGKIFTGKKYDLTNDLSAFETKLGWVIMGKDTSEKTVLLSNSQCL